MNQEQQTGKVVIVGGGIAGLCSAYYLMKDGWKVTLIDSGDFTNNCSYGNAGMVVPSHFTPLAAPGIIGQGLKWLLDSKSPFYIRPALNRNFMDWAWKFFRHANAAHVEASAPHLRDLNLFSQSLYRKLAKEPGFDFGWSDRGILMLYKTEKGGEEEEHLAQAARSLGLEVDLLSATEVQALEPDIRLDTLGAAHYRCDSHLRPGALMEQLIRFLRASGVRFLANSRVTGFKTRGKNVRKVLTDRDELEADCVVVTGGARLPEIMQQAGLRIPLMPGKGYSFLHKTDSGVLRHPALLTEARVAATPMNGSIRFGGTMELGPMNQKINMNRVRGIVDAIPEYYPDLQIDIPDRKDIWFGFRPCSPDGLPYLGSTRRLENLFLAGGSGMMGLSLGPAMGKLISELAGRRDPSISLDAFHPERFR